MHKHIINGASAAGALRQYLHEPKENFAVFGDLFFVGPLLSVKNEEEFISSRIKFWADNAYDYEDFSYSQSEHVNEFFREFVTNIKSADSFTLWLAPGAQDQIMWAWLVHLFDLYKKDWKNVQIKHLFNEEKSKFPYIGLGELEPEKFALCQDFEIEENQIDYLRTAYDALISDTPELLLEICACKDAPLPELKKSLTAYLKSYPDKRTGLSIFEKGMLIHCEDRPRKSARIVAHGIMYEEYDNRFIIGDIYLFNRLVKLSEVHCNHPLIKLHGTVRGNESMRFTEVEITDLGKAVLAGKENQIELNGIDQFIGGVHLSSKEKTALWFYERGNVVKG